MRAIIVDIDGTLSDDAWRADMMGNWDEYYEASRLDSPHKDNVEMLNALHKFGFPIIGCTGRPEKWRALTMNWLFRNKVEMDELLMRGDDDRRPAALVKVDLVRGRFPNLSNVLCVFDDREDAVSAFQAMGIKGFQVRA